MRISVFFRRATRKATPPKSQSGRASPDATEQNRVASLLAFRRHDFAARSHLALLLSPQCTMGNRKISLDFKECCLRLWENGWDVSDVCYVMRISVASMYRWDAIKDKFGSPEKPPSTLRGRTRSIGLAALTAAQDIYRRHPETYLDELRWWLLIHHDIDISISALQATLTKAGLTRKLLHKVARERDELQRADFLAGIRNRANFSGTGEEFVTVDESSKNDFTLQRRYGRAYAGQQATLVGPFI